MDLVPIKTKSVASSSVVNNVEEKKEDDELECAVCLQTCIHPVQLPCSHIFCFLCVKGVANQSKRCAMCRQEIPADFLEHPILLKKIDEPEEEKEGYQWFYGGRNGWWQYDERTSSDLEAAYSQGVRTFEILVAGFLYSVDFDRMIQQRRNDPNRRRRIKRDLATIPSKGVAGLKSSNSEELYDEPQSTNPPGVIPSLASLANSQISSVPSQQIIDPVNLAANSERTRPEIVAIRDRRNRRTIFMIRPESNSNETTATQPSLETTSQHSQVDRDIVDSVNNLAGSLTGLSISDQDDNQTEEYLLPASDEAF